MAVMNSLIVILIREHLNLLTCPFCYKLIVVLNPMASIVGKTVTLSTEKKNLMGPLVSLPPI